MQAGEQMEGTVVAGMTHSIWAFGDGDPCGNPVGCLEKALHEDWSTGGYGVVVKRTQN